MKKAIVLTGGANGIGRAIVECLHTNVDLFVIDRDEAAGKALEGKLSDPHLHFMFGDLAKEADLKRFVTQIKSETESIHGIIHNAAIDKGGLKSDASYADFMETFQVNVGSAYYLVKHLQDYFSDDMSIILLSSTRHSQSMENNETYATSKGAILSLAHALANSLKTRARVNAISPGWIDVSSLQYQSESFPLSQSDHLQHPVGRVGKPTDIVSMVEFLLDDQKSGFITGQEFIVDGGMKTQMIYHDEFGWRYSP